MNNLSSPSEDLIRIVFEAGFVRRFHVLSPGTDYLIMKYCDKLMYYYKKGESIKGINSIAYIQLQELLNQLNLTNGNR